jgi:hypothetical protein
LLKIEEREAKQRALTKVYDLLPTINLLALST